ncbi:hypothetical protein Golob_006572, partial [Gossypium lobatum]|nr:hypothetical protein [Gossypium lobatum]
PTIDNNSHQTQLIIFIVLCSSKVLSWNPILTNDSGGSGRSCYRRTKNGGELSPLRFYGLKNVDFKNE